MLEPIRAMLTRLICWQVGIGDFRDDPSRWLFVPVSRTGRPWLRFADVVRWPGGWRLRVLGWLCFVDAVRDEPLYEPVCQVEYSGLDHGAWLEISFSAGYHGRLVVLLPTTLTGVFEVGPGEIRWQSYGEGP